MSTQQTTTDVNEITDWIPVAEAVRLLPSCRPGKRLALSTLYRWIFKGRIQGRKCGPYYFVRRSQIIDQLKPIPPRPRQMTAPDLKAQAMEHDRESRKVSRETKRILAEFDI